VAPIEQLLPWYSRKVGLEVALERDAARIRRKAA
jgi:hypothetical protein